LSIMRMAQFVIWIWNANRPASQNGHFQKIACIAVSIAHNSSKGLRTEQPGFCLERLILWSVL
ncbi:MAG TPA: hypothetical protein VG754_10460, partial [Verrucomicrobiae bacterium]|nr:hypothetical protein [Verrucomicrobiae bacterium]